jgi:hypothetical protein
MSRLLSIVALVVLFGAAANASDFSCASWKEVNLSRVLRVENVYKGQCIRTRGVMRAAPKLGVTLRPAVHDTDRIALYFENDDQPEDLDTHPQYAEISGRVLGCGDIWRNAEIAADRANREEKAHPHPDAPTIVYLGMVFGICHYKDAVAILVSDHKLLPMPTN